MHYYQFNIGDYASHTRHLSLMEDLAFRRLIDLYYLHEQPLNECSTTVARLINMRDHEAEVQVILSEFFEKNEDGGWINRRADQEIEKFRSKLDAASKAGKASAERRLNGRSTDVQPNKNQEPRTKNQKTRESIEVVEPFDSPITEPVQPTAAGKTCKRLAQLGITGVNPMHPGLLELLKAGITEDEIVAVGAEPKAKGKGMAWVLATVRGRRQDAQQAEPLPKASTEKQWFESAGGIEQRGRELNLKLEPGEPFQSFKARVFEKAELPEDVVRKARIDAGMRP